MTKDKAIAELVRIWHSPHLDLSLKAGLAEVIETLKETNQGESLVTDSSDDCKESESKLDLISRADAIEAIESRQTEQWIESDIDYNSGLESALCEIKALPSAEPKTGKWVKVIDQETPNVTKWHYECDQCGAGRFEKCQKYCSRCGARMYKDGEDE